MAARGLSKVVQVATASDLANTIKTTGGHGGPPLQFAERLWKVPQRVSKSALENNFLLCFWGQIESAQTLH